MKERAYPIKFLDNFSPLDENGGKGARASNGLNTRGVRERRY